MLQGVMSWAVLRWERVLAMGHTRAVLLRDIPGMTRSLMLWAWILREIEIVGGEVSAAVARGGIGGLIAMTVRGRVDTEGIVRDVTTTEIVAIAVTGIGRGPGPEMEVAGEGHGQEVRTETSTGDIGQRTVAIRRIVDEIIVRINETGTQTTIAGTNVFQIIMTIGALGWAFEISGFGRR